MLVVVADDCVWVVCLLWGVLLLFGSDLLSCGVWLLIVLFAYSCDCSFCFCYCLLLLYCVICWFVLRGFVLRVGICGVAVWCLVFGLCVFLLVLWLACVGGELVMLLGFAV